MLTNAKRMTPELRKKFIVEQGLNLARQSHYLVFTRAELANQCQVSPGLINAYFGGIDELRAAVLELAIKRKTVEVVAQALALHSPMVKNIDDELKQKAIAYIEG